MTILSQQQPLRLALYARVSTEEQAKNENIGQQLDLGRGWAKTHHHTIVREYLDDGVSGTMFFDDRGGKALLADGKAKLFDGVVIRDTDRLTRDEEAGFAAIRVIKKAGLRLFVINEGIQIDPRAPDDSEDFNMGIHILLAAKDRRKRLKQLSQGRDYRTETGRWTNGPVPFGLDLDRAHHLTLSERVIEHLGRTEADVIREMLLRLMNGSSQGKEAERLNALGVPMVSRWRNDREGNKRERVNTKPWYRERIAAMARNPIYKGVHELDSRFGTKTYAEVPALITPAQWERLQAVMERQKSMPSRQTKRDYLLRGLIRCVNCGKAFIGHVAPSHGRPAAYTYYWCGSHRAPAGSQEQNCYSKSVNAPWLEQEAWDWCRALICDPGPALERARAELEQPQDGGGQEERTRELRQRIAGLDGERERTMKLYTEAQLLTLEQVKAQTKQIDDKIAVLRAELEGLAAQAASVRAYAGQLSSLEADLAGLRADVEEVERSGDIERKRALLQRFIRRIDVESFGERRHKTATVTIHGVFGEPHMLADDGGGDPDGGESAIAEGKRVNPFSAGYKPLVLTHTLAVPAVTHAAS